jgi:AraC-like DNA-binding protein
MSQVAADLNPEAVQPAMLLRPSQVQYFELVPSKELSPLVDRFYVLRTSADCRASYRVVADGCADLLFDCSGARGSMTTLSLSRPLLFELPASICVLGVRLRPGALGRLLTHGDAARDGGIYDLESLPVRERLLPGNGKRDPLSLMREMEDRLHQSTTRDDDSRLLTEAALRRLRNVDGAGTESSIAQDFGLSERHFRRLITARLGVPPKRYRRVLRFQDSLKSLIRAPQINLADLAAQHGYFDQAHLTHEWVALSGQAPVVWRGRFLQDATRREA